MTNLLFINQDTSSEIMVHDEPIDYMLETSEDSVAALLSDTTDKEYEINTNNDNLKYIPLATKTTYGVIKVGDGLSIVNGVLNVIGGGGSGGSNITKLSELENDVGFITNNTQTLVYYPTKTEVDAQVLNLQNTKADKTALNGLITNTVDDLINYYKKSDTYNKTEVNELVSKIPKFSVTVVEDLNSIPENERSNTTIYLVPKTDIANGDYYEEVLWLNGVWELFGSVRVNLNNYYTKSEANSEFIDFTSIQNVSGRKNFEEISLKNIFYVGKNEEDEDVLLRMISASIDSLRIGDEGVSISFISNSRPVLYEGENLTRRELAYLSDMPNVPTKLSQLNNDSGFITQTALDLNYFTAGEVMQEIEAEIDKLRIPTKLSELSTDTNNQRVSVTEKTTWNNKSNFDGKYSSLSGKPDLSSYLTASSTTDITGRKTFIGQTLQLAPTAGAQPTYIEVGANHDTFKVRGMYNFINLDYSGTYPVIQFLGNDVLADTWGPQTMNGLKTFYNQGDGALRVNTYNGSSGIEFGGSGYVNSRLVPSMKVYSYDGTSVSLNIPTSKNGTLALLEDLTDVGGGITIRRWS